MPATKTSGSLSTRTRSRPQAQQTSPPARLPHNRAVRALTTGRIFTAEIPTKDEYKQELAAYARAKGVSEVDAVPLAVRDAFEYEQEPGREWLLNSLHKIALAIDALLILKDNSGNGEVKAPTRILAAEIPTKDEYKQELAEYARMKGVSEANAIPLAVRHAFEYEQEPDRKELLNSLHKIALSIDAFLIECDP
jgi:hypothetical protein